MFGNRRYRDLVKSDTLEHYRVTVKETDLSIYSNIDVCSDIRESVLKFRGIIESFIHAYPKFMKTLIPFFEKGPVPQIIKHMIDAGHVAGTGPMAAVAGTISEFTVKDIINRNNKVTDLIIENGGDTFIYSGKPYTVAIHAGRSPLSMKFGITFDETKEYVSICTSSGTIGHSLSFGKSDAVCVISESGALADAIATSLGNKVKNVSDIKKTIDIGKKIIGVEGLVIIKNDKIGIWGNIKLVPILLKA